MLWTEAVGIIVIIYVASHLQRKLLCRFVNEG